MAPPPPPGPGDKVADTGEWHRDPPSRWSLTFPQGLRFGCSAALCLLISIRDASLVSFFPSSGQGRDYQFIGPSCQPFHSPFHAVLKWLFRLSSRTSLLTVFLVLTYFITWRLNELSSFLLPLSSFELCSVIGILSLFCTLNAYLKSSDLAVLLISLWTMCLGALTFPFAHGSCFCDLVFLLLSELL